MAGSGVEWARQAHAALAELWPPPTCPGADEHDTLVMKEKALIRGDFADDKCVVLITGRRQGERPPVGPSHRGRLPPSAPTWRRELEMTRRFYTGPVIDVSFDGEICQHAAECVRGVPEVSTPRPARESTPG